MNRGYESMQRSFAAGLISATLIFACLSLANASAATTAQDAQPQPAPPAAGAPPQAQQHRPMPKPTNLKVLPKDIAPPDLMALMRGYTKALGVECEFCHAENPQTHKLNFPSDAKPEKETARTMISMTREINEKYLSTVNDPDATPADKTVTCGTCHRGKSMPALFSPKPGGGMHQEHPGAPATPKSE
jgi:hypothetical protein